MSADAYLQQVLNREAVDTGIFSPVRAVQATLEPAIRLWANRFLIGVTPSGSFAKGTANKSGTDDRHSSLPRRPQTLVHRIQHLVRNWSQNCEIMISRALRFTIRLIEKLIRAKSTHDQTET